jgi:signal transduction histidine kinase
LDIYAKAVDAGKSLLFPDVVATLGTGSEALAQLQPFGLSSSIVVPLQAGDRCFGAVALVRADKTQPYNATILAFVEELVERLALTLENARLYRMARAVEVELRQLNETLEDRVAARTAELERSNRELDRFAYVASHDLKAPLRAIDNLANWIAADAAAILPEPSQEHLAKLRGRVRRMERLLDDLLTYSRAGRIQHQPERIETAALVRNTFELLAPPPDFMLVVAEPMPTFVTQRVPLETVLRNLIGNAIKHHTRHDGTVSVSAVADGDWLEFTVADDGPGVAPEYHERIFDMFQTLLPRDQIEGSGMGLAIVKKTVESVGGRVTLDSMPEQGARFSFTWPRQLAPP